MAHCCVVYCNNDWRKQDCQNLSFHRFPLNSVLKKSWIVAIRRDEGPDFKITNGTYVCSAHFKAVDYKFSMCKRRILKPNAVPSIFSWTNERKPQKEPKQCSTTSTSSMCLASSSTIVTANSVTETSVSDESVFVKNIGTSSEDAKSDSGPHQANTISHAKRSLKQCRKRRNLTIASHTGDDGPNKILFDQIRTDAYKLVVNSQVWHILDDGSDGLTIGILQQHQTFITVRIIAEDLTAEIAVLGIPRRAKESLIDKPLVTLIDEVAAMSVCPGINDPSVQSLADYPRPEEHCGFFRHIVFNVDGGVMTHSSRILSTTCARLIQPSESICSQCELVFKLLTMSCDT